MESAEFRDGLDALVALAASTSVSVMCSESLWWKCHRRLLADAPGLLRSVPVTHHFHDGRLDLHSPTQEAWVSDGRLVYDLGVTAPLL
ncbi:MAG TPA: DUF488 domain-containing protein [Acidimicrobiales bacterium]|nr:DUF488 domain-containing protein [Acidimicrobiales bacterium]